MIWLMFMYNQPVTFPLSRKSYTLIRFYFDFLDSTVVPTDGVLAGAADEALLMPLSGLVLHLLHACPHKYIS
jgi:hypothetical protein